MFLNIDKRLGLAPWKLVFAYIVDLISNINLVIK